MTYMNINIPEILEKTFEHLHNVQKTVVEGLYYKSWDLTTLYVWVNDPEIYEHLNSTKSA
ncbi:hypothetical protein DSO57_1035351 [Entomophthora muscae]|uniref:Uncharacterized protein n=1 Tax=Entomophthora muscae TaxID=34485 RepID=A0ACC2TLC6_9FUNG|nr:hypothetical protein DSO57_1035351 [Entomophthora muscae]